MKRLFSLASLIWIVLILLVTSGLAVGRTQPVSSSIAMLHPESCELPCWIGIIPGQTTLSEAKQRIEQVFGDASTYSISSETDPRFGLFLSVTDYSINTDIKVELRIADEQLTDQSIVKQLSLTLTDTSGYLNKNPSIPDVFSILGSPSETYLSGYYDPPNPVLIYKPQHLSVFIDRLPQSCNKILLNQLVLGLTITAELPTPTFGSTLPQRWHGFGRCYDFEPIE